MKAGLPKRRAAHGVARGRVLKPANGFAAQGPADLSLDFRLASLEADETILCGEFLRLSPCPSVVLDDSGRICDVNEQFRELAGIRPSQVNRASFSSHVHRSSLSEYLTHLWAVRQSRPTGSVGISLIGKQGEPVAVRLFTRYCPTARPAHYRLAIVDDTEKQLARKNAQREHETYLELIDSLDAIVWEMDGETGRTTYFSKKAERLFGAMTNDWHLDRACRWNQVHVDDRERVLNQLARAVALREDFVTEYRTHTADRKLVWLQDSVSIRQMEGRLKVRGVAVDITDKKTAESRAILAAEELERRVEERTAELKWTIAELESFSYTLSHDMRAPLRSIEGYAAMIAEAAESNAQVDTADCLRRIRRSARRLDALVQDVLKYSGLARLPIDLKPINLNSLVTAMADEAMWFKVPGAKIDVAEHLLPVLGHEGFLSQCISNLLSNAAKFAGPHTAPMVRIWTQEDGDFVQLSVKDNGIGIAAGDHLRIFKVFERCHRQIKTEGAGLGLAIVKRAAERMGGTVGVESAPGQGSTFWIRLHKA